MFSSKSHQSLNIIVIGGSISGLSAAYYLAQAGHSVLLLEKRKIEVWKEKQFGGLRIPPSMARLLKELPGMEDILEQHGCINKGFLLYEGENLDLIGEMEFEENITKDFGTLYYRLMYSTLWNHLYDLCKIAAVPCRYDCQATAISLGNTLNDPTTVTVATGEHFTCDVVIGADGHQSIVRELILNEARQSDGIDVPKSETHQTVSISLKSAFSSCRVSIPMKNMRDYPCLQPLTENNWTTVWMANGVSYVGEKESTDQFGIRMLCVHPMFDDMDWNEMEKPLELPEVNMDDCDCRLRLLLSMSKSCHRSKQEFSELSSFTNSAFQVILVGNAASNAMINGEHNAEIALEDSYTLGYLFSRLRTREQIPLFLKAYNSIRGDRTAFLRHHETAVVDMLGYCPGPQRQQRKEAYGPTLQKGDLTNEELGQVWSDHIAENDYDARDVIAEWWHMWGRLL